jgi:hypothetical protein
VRPFESTRILPIVALSAVFTSPVMAVGAAEAEAEGCVVVVELFAQPAVPATSSRASTNVLIDGLLLGRTIKVQ